MKSLGKEHGFTLVELLVVISIIALLSSVVLASVNGVRDSARQKIALQFAAQNDRIMGDEAVGIWNFEEGSGTVAKDTSGWGNDGTIIGATYTTDTYNSAVSGHALSFGGSDYVQLSRSLGLGDSNFTFSEWIMTNSLSNQMYTLGNAGSSNGYRFGLSDGKIAFLIGNGSSYIERTCGVKSMSDGVWHNIVGDLNRSSRVFTCYADGVKTGTVAISLYPGMSDSPGKIGKPPCCASVVAKIDDVRVFTRSLTAQEIKEQHLAGLDTLYANGAIDADEYHARLLAVE